MAGVRDSYLLDVTDFVVGEVDSGGGTSKALVYARYQAIGGDEFYGVTVHYYRA